MPYANPTIYTYQVVGISPPGFGGSTSITRFTPQFSSNGGSTWTDIGTQTYDSKVDAMNQIDFILDNEAGFQTRVNANTVQPVKVNYPYPPVGPT